MSFSFYLAFEVDDPNEAEAICKMSPRQRSEACLDIIVGGERRSFLERQYRKILNEAVKDPTSHWTHARARVFCGIGVNDAIEVMENLEALGNFTRTRSGRKSAWLLRDAVLVLPEYY